MRRFMVNTCRWTALLSLAGLVQVMADDKYLQSAAPAAAGQGAKDLNLPPAAQVIDPKIKSQLPIAPAIGSAPLFRARQQAGQELKQKYPLANPTLPWLPSGTGNRLGGPVGQPNLGRLTTLPQGAAGLPRDFGNGTLVPGGVSRPAPNTPTLTNETVAQPAKNNEGMVHRGFARVEEGPPAPPPPPGPERGRFQVAIVGFDVSRQTRDDFVASDGHGDEVFVHCAVHHLRGTTLTPMLVHSAQIGDANHIERIRAGSAGDNGGLRSGDLVGSRRLATGFPADGFRAMRLPLLVFDGELQAGRDAVLIAPSVWEWDNWGLPPATGGLFRFGDFHSNPSDPENRAGTYESLMASMTRRPAFARRLAEVLADRPTSGSGPTVAPGRGLYPSVMGDMGGNRPIGMSRQEDDWAWQPLSLGLNYHWADFISRTEFDGASGVISIRYSDAPELEGNYTLHLQIRRLE